MREIIISFALFTIGLGVIGCTGSQTFGTAARAGDTIAISTGWNQELTASDYTVQITDALSIVTPVSARAVINTFPDPVSNLIIERWTDTSGDPDAGGFWLNQIRDNITNQDRDISQQVVFIDLPLTLNPGAATIDISGPGYTPDPIDLEVLPLAAGTGSVNQFGIQDTLTGTTLGVSLGSRLRLSERAPHNVITFTGSTLPYGIEITFTHDPDQLGGGDPNGGIAYVTSGRSDVKNIAWSDSGTELTVIMTPSRLSPIVSIKRMVDFKFYIAGTTTGLAYSSMAAYDDNGVPVAGIGCEIDGVTC